MWEHGKQDMGRQSCRMRDYGKQDMAGRGSRMQRHSTAGCGDGELRRWGCGCGWGTGSSGCGCGMQMIGHPGASLPSSQGFAASCLQLGHGDGPTWDPALCPAPGPRLGTEPAQRTPLWGS